nr:kinesin-related protein 8-like isoform X1 [Osmia lignaria]
MANIKVAVRVRPISARELHLTGSEVVVRTDVNGISLTNLKVSSSKAGDSRERTKRYGFDYCFDSSDQQAENFADQARIYETLGQSVLEALFSGYNSCLVAYGQSASGKTYTMMGTKDDPGLTPRLCKGLFARMEEEAKNEKNYCVSVSYLEIYNERVRDLLKPSSSTTGLRVREHPRLGPYVQGLTHHVVRRLGSLMSYVEEGTKARKTASTLQNPSSSRSHALLTIGLTEETPSVASGAVTSPSTSTRRNEISPRAGSKLRLVDLAGSESAATCSGVHRLKEGANINKSLVALGNVISALAERGSTGSGPGRRFIPYRDSSLTWLLKDALGGNATTIMLATISPASGSYNETAHTLRFAQRAQSVVNRPVVNEDPVARIIRDLRAEVARLKSLLVEKNIEPSIKALCDCYKNQLLDSINQQSNKGTEVEDSESIKTSKKEGTEIKGSKEDEGLKVDDHKGSTCLPTFRRSNSTDSVIVCEADSSIKKFSSFESLTTADRFAGNYKRARVTELNDEEDEAREIHESVFVDIPTLVAVLIKPDDNLQETSAQIEEICSDEVAEDSIEFIEAANDRETFEDPEKLDGVDHDERSSSVNSCHASGDNELDAYQQPVSSSSSTVSKLRQKPKFRKQDSVDILSPSISSNLHTSKRFGSVETILKRKKEPVFSLERSHTNLEKRQTLGGKKLNNIREIEDQQLCTGSNWRGSKDQLQRKGSNESDKSLKEKTKNHARKPSLENLKRKTSKDSSSSSSKDEQILISSLARDKLLRRKSSIEQEATSIRSHTPIQRVKRAEIVAAVTERLYSSRKPAEDVPEVRSPPENANVKSLAKMKLQEISRKMLGKRRRVCVETQTECLQTVRLKDTASLTETPKILCKDVGVLTDDHVGCEQLMVRKIPILRVKEIATLTDKPKTRIVRCKDVASLANDLEEFDYEFHSPRNDSGILSDDTQNYAESNLSSTEVSDLCPETDRRVYTESSTNTVVFSPCRSFAVQTPRPESFNQQPTENKTLVCLRQCCNSIESSQSRSTSGNIEKNVISISLPDTLNIVIETRNALESKVSVTDNDSSKEKLKSNRKECETQTEESNEAVPSKDAGRSILSQTDGRVFRIENIFQDPNNVSNGSARVDVVADRTEGTRNSITFRNSLGTSYVFEGKQGEPGGDRLHGEGFIRDGLITEAFITRKRSFNFKRAPSTIVYRNPWRNWSFSDPLANAIHSIDRAKGSTTTPSSWQPQTDEIPAVSTNLSLEENNGVLRQCQTEPEEINVEGISQIKPSSSNDHDHGFSDDSLDYNEINASTESSTKLKQMTEKRESFCPPDVVAHTKKDCSKSIESEKVEPEEDFEDSQVEFPKKNPVESIEPTKIHDYKSLILGRSCYNYEEVNEESDGSTSRVNNIGKKKVSFSSSSVPQNKVDRNQSLKPTLKSIIKKRRKKNVSEPVETVQSSNDETDDSQQEEKASLTSETDWKGDVQSTSSEEMFREEQDVAGSSRDHKQNCKKVKFSEEELHENTCSESDSFENPDDDEEDVSYHSPTRNILEEYLSEAMIFMRNLNSINEFVNSTSMLERNASPSHGSGGKRGSRRRSSFSDRNRDYEEPRGRRVSLKEDTDDPPSNDDIVLSTESYERCLKGIQRLEECIRRVDKHNELLREKYGVDCESAGARLSLASPSTDPRVPTTSNEFTIPPNTDDLYDQPSNVTEQLANPRLTESSQENDLEKRIFDQLMNVANSVRCGTSSKHRLSKSIGSRSQSPGSYSKFREKHNQAIRESFPGDLSGSFSLEGTSDGNDQEDVTTYEITGNLSVGRTRSMDQIVDDDLDSTMEEDFLPLRRFNSSSWSSNAKNTEARFLGLPSRTIKRDDSSKYNFPSNYETMNGSRFIDIDDSSRKSFKSFPVHRVPSSDNTRKREFHESDDYSRRIRNSGSKVCGCLKDQSDIESSSELLRLRDKLKYPGSPRARFLELLRERRRIVEYSRGTSAS